MPVADVCEPQVIHALEKIGWRVINRQFPLRLDPLVGKGLLLADLRLQKSQDVMMVVEVKCFINEKRILDAFYYAVGQYLVYRSALAIAQIDEPIYLVVPSFLAFTFLKQATIQFLLQSIIIRVIVVD